MAKGRPYEVPMTLTETQSRLEQVTAMGMHVNMTPAASSCDFVVRRVQVGRNGREKILDVAQGKMTRVEDDLTRIEPLLKIVPIWRLILVYGLLLTLGFTLALILALATGEIFSMSTVGRRTVVFLILYTLAFLIVQPQRLFLGSANDDRLHAYIKGVLSGPYADINNLYVQHFNQTRYWETR